MSKAKFGTAPVFFTAISTILGAILFLRFGYAIGTVGFWGVIFIILIGHMVTIPTALAISEIATNKRVQGGGEYFIISRSFGLNIGATIGMALFLSQAISVAFYVIAFTEAFSPVFEWIKANYGINLPRQAFSVPAMLLLSFLILKKGANMGVKALYVVVAVLFVALALIFAGAPQGGETSYFSENLALRNSSDFFVVFAIIFPAFTGMTAGVGLSGDLRNPGKSIPLGTVAATISGIVIYIFLAWKMASSAPAEGLVNDQLIMAQIAPYGFIMIPLGLAASTISSALGSVMVAPRTLQALSGDHSLPWSRANGILSATRKKDGEPFNASLVTCIIAMVFVILGDVDIVAQIITMFFMVTYGSLSLISFLNHFGSAPSYRPSFKSRWYISLIGFIMAVWLMFKIDALYALAAVIAIGVLYIYINNVYKHRRGMEDIFKGAFFQLNRRLQVYMQKTYNSRKKTEWRPSAICISSDSFNRQKALEFMNWIAWKYGFGTYIHMKNGYFSTKLAQEARKELEKLVNIIDQKESAVYVDTMISPSYTSAVAQAIQLPGVSGMENNMVVFESLRTDEAHMQAIVENMPLAKAGDFDICLYCSTLKPVNFKNGIHVWIRSTDVDNANEMILLSYIISAHPAWEKAGISIFNIAQHGQKEEARKALLEIVEAGRLPISAKNIESVEVGEDQTQRSVIEAKSADAGLVIIGFLEEQVKHDGKSIFMGYDAMGDILFVNSRNEKTIVE
ncbi:APC family permease [Salinivirga cyanobacteriivorans]